MFQQAEGEVVHKPRNAENFIQKSLALLKNNFIRNSVFTQQAAAFLTLTPDFLLIGILLELNILSGLKSLCTDRHEFD